MSNNTARAARLRRSRLIAGFHTWVATVDAAAERQEKMDAKALEIETFGKKIAASHGREQLSAGIDSWRGIAKIIRMTRCDENAEVDSKAPRLIVGGMALPELASTPDACSASTARVLSHHLLASSYTPLSVILKLFLPLAAPCSERHFEKNESRGTGVVPGVFFCFSDIPFFLQNIYCLNQSLKSSMIRLHAPRCVLNTFGRNSSLSRQYIHLSCPFLISGLTDGGTTPNVHRNLP